MRAEYRIERAFQTHSWIFQFLAVVFVLIVGDAFFSSTWASLQVQPSNGGSLSSSSTGGNTFYYFVKGGSGSGVPAPPAFGFFGTGLDINQTSSTDANANNYFEVTLTSTASYAKVTGTQQAVVTIQASPVNTTTPRYAPIAFVNGVACSANNCQSQNNPSPSNPPPTPPSTNWFYAAKFYPTTSNQIKIGFYLADICADFAGQTATGCAPGAAGVTPPTSGTPTLVPLTFSVFVADNGNLNTGPTGTAIDTVTNPISFSLQVDTPKLTCPDSATLKNNYRPGDGSIFFNPAGIGTTYLSTCPACAPAQSLKAVGNEKAPAIVDSTFMSANSVVWSMMPGAFEQTIGGLKNSSSDEQHRYNISFIMVDQAGIYAPPNSDGSGRPATCILGEVQAAAIQGFLGKSNCFIATAAFGSPDNQAVALLRRFRDSVLLSYPFGRAFVSWYYGWSPGSAVWLIQHSIFRIPVLLVLGWVEAFAWICLHPWIGIGGVLFGLLLLLQMTVQTSNRGFRGRIGADQGFQRRTMGDGDSSEDMASRNS